MLFSPRFYHYPFILLLSPFSLLYIFFTFVNAFQKHLQRVSFSDIEIVGVGNLLLGGTGKTPFTIALAKREKRKVAVILRGYGRESRGVLVVSKNGEILIDILESGDEAMLYAKSLPNGTVIVSEDRIKGVKLAKELGSEVIFLDDSYRQHHIKKDREFLIESTSSNPLPFPAGGYREKLWFFKKDIERVKEGRDFVRRVTLQNPTEKMVLVTAISKPERLNRFLPDNISKHHFPDHYKFSKNELTEIIKMENATSIVTTEKDFVKMEEYNLPISLLKLEVDLVVSKLQ
jgi:tetraacyldisaccharide 4'-kinase